MADRFRALLVNKKGDTQSVALVELNVSDLMEGDVTVAVEHSTVNYKDGLAITGKRPVVRKFPLIPGIDLAGRVLRSQNSRFQIGDRVVLNGYGLGEVHHGAMLSGLALRATGLFCFPRTFRQPMPWPLGLQALQPCFA